jgi:hypothetical protein
MRLGLISSVAAHAAVLLVAIIVLASPRHIESAPSEPIDVDIVREQKRAETAKDVPQIDLPRERPADNPAPDASAQASAQGPQAQGPSPVQPAVPDLFAPDATPKPVYFPKLMIEPRDAETEFDAPADAVARLSRADVAALQAHVQKCWKAPARLAQGQNVRAVLRIMLDPKGAMTTDPILVKASASSLGPPLVESAMRALRQCQPFGVLPADKYDEWKVLELTFSPQGLSAE